MVQASRFLSLGEAGDGDSYVLYDVMSFLKTGRIYRDFSAPPYLPAQYSPLVYILYALPTRMLTLENLFIGPRIFALVSFLICVVLTASITRKLIPARLAGLWSMLLALSIGSTRDWVLMLRGDFPGISLALLSIRLLLTRSPAWVVFAGVAAGLATQFKITYVSGIVTGVIWLAVCRRWNTIALFTGGAAVASVCMYLLLWLREPLMPAHILALSPGVVDVLGWIKLLYKAFREPVVLLALLIIPASSARVSPQWYLIGIFATVSFAVATFTDLQAGGNVNYFFEFFFALIPMAVLGTLRVIAWAREHTAIVLALGLLLPHFLPTEDLYASVREEVIRRNRSEIENDQSFRKMQSVLSGQRILSTVPRFALIDPSPVLMEPYLLSYLQRIGKFDPKPILERVESREFMVVITYAYPASWRGVPVLSPNLRKAIAAAYYPQCVLLEPEPPPARSSSSPLQILLHLRRDSDSNALIEQLANIGCLPVVGSSHAYDW
jgi:hypothetical protein